MYVTEKTFINIITEYQEQYGTENHLCGTPEETSCHRLVPGWVTTRDDRTLCPFVGVNINLCPIVNIAIIVLIQTQNKSTKHAE